MILKKKQCITRVYQNEYSGVQLHTFHSWDCRYLCVYYNVCHSVFEFWLTPVVWPAASFVQLLKYKNWPVVIFTWDFALLIFPHLLIPPCLLLTSQTLTAWGWFCTACAVRHHTSQSQRGSQLLCCWYSSLLTGLGQLGKMSKSCGLCNLHRKPHATPILFQLWPMIVTSIWGTNQWMALLSLSLLLYFCLLSQRNKPLKKMACSKPCVCSYLHLWLRQHIWVQTTRRIKSKQASWLNAEPPKEKIYTQLTSITPGKKVKTFT